MHTSYDCKIATAIANDTNNLPAPTLSDDDDEAIITSLPPVFSSSDSEAAPPPPRARKRGLDDEERDIPGNQQELKTNRLETTTAKRASKPDPPSPAPAPKLSLLLLEHQKQSSGSVIQQVPSRRTF